MTGNSNDIIVIEPRSRISSFETLGYYTTMAINGAIAGALYGKDKEKGKTFFKSKANLKNKQVSSKLTSEVYSYLNAVIGDFADPEDYFFRLWVRLEIDKKTGLIVGEPTFEIDLFKYAGKLGGKYIETGDYALSVVFVGKEGTYIAPMILKGIKQVSNATGLIKFKAYDSYKHAPSEIQEIISEDSPFLIIDGKPIEVKFKIDEKKHIPIPYVEKGGKDFDLPRQESIENLVLSEVKMKPEIRKSGTAFQLVDEELKELHKRIEQDSTETKEPDLLKSLKLDIILEEFENDLKKIETFKFTEEQQNLYENYRKQLHKLKDRYHHMSREWETLRKEIDESKQDMHEGEITYEEFGTIRVRRSKALKNVEQQLIEFQEELKRDLVPMLHGFFSGMEGKRVGK